MAGTFENDNTAINKILTQEANRIGGDIHKSTMHTSPWIDLIKQTTFPEGMGYQLNTLIYDRALPLKSGTLATDPVLGVNWNSIQHSAAASGVTDIAIIIPIIPNKLPCLDVSGDDNPLKAKINKTPESK